MRKHAYTEKQHETIVNVLANLEDVGTHYPELDHPVELIDSAELCNHVNDFMEKMNILFKRYQEDGCMDNYSRDGEFFTVGKEDADYMWSALDGAIHMYNMIHPGNELIVDHYNTTEMEETYIVQYKVDYE